MAKSPKSARRMARPICALCKAIAIQYDDRARGKSGLSDMLPPVHEFYAVWHPDDRPAKGAQSTTRAFFAIRFFQTRGAAPSKSMSARAAGAPPWTQRGRGGFVAQCRPTACCRQRSLRRSSGSSLVSQWPAGDLGVTMRLGLPHRLTERSAARNWASSRAYQTRAVHHDSNGTDTTFV